MSAAPFDTGRSSGRDYREVVVFIAIFAIALLVGCVGVERSGTHWQDGPQYANAGAMIRDWIRSGQLLHPFEFARTNYVQYPAFSIPYHPPGYPALLGGFFLLSGVSYESARVFIALLLGLAGCSFYAILRRFAVDRVPAFVCAMLLLTMPEIAKWSRDTMSETPALAFILVSAYGFLRWIETNHYRDAALAFVFAGLAFFSKINVIGVLLALPVWIVLRGRWRTMLSPSLIVPGVVFAIVVVAWSKFFIPYARFETQIGLTPAEQAAAQASGSTFRPNAQLSTYLLALPSMSGWILLVASVAGLIVALRLRKGRRSGVMWLAWFAGYLAFLMILPLHYEARYFVFALPAIPALAALIFLARAETRALGWIGYALVVAALGENVVRMRSQSRGVVGYEGVARKLATLGEPGNVLVSVPFQNDLMFRYRAVSPASRRQFIRGDRSITIRLSNYAPVSLRSRVLVNDSQSFVGLIRRGRIRYVVAVKPSPTRDMNGESADETLIAARDVDSLPADFAPVDSFPVSFGELGAEPEMWIKLWAYRHPLPDGPSEVPVTIPTARFTFRPGDTSVKK